MSYTRLYYHIVFSTKNRKPRLFEPHAARIMAYLKGIAGNLNAHIERIGGATDHLHILSELPADLAVADFVRILKANSSKWARQEFDRLFGWQDGYAAFSVSHSVVGKVAAYIDSQGEHHKKLTFEEELTALLKKHNISCDWIASVDAEAKDSDNVSPLNGAK